MCGHRPCCSLFDYPHATCSSAETLIMIYLDLDPQKNAIACRCFTSSVRPLTIQAISARGRGGVRSAASSFVVALVGHRLFELRPQASCFGDNQFFALVGHRPFEIRPQASYFGDAPITCPQCLSARIVRFSVLLGAHHRARGEVARSSILRYLRLFAPFARACYM